MLSFIQIYKHKTSILNRLHIKSIVDNVITNDPSKQKAEKSRSKVLFYHLSRMHRIFVDLNIPEKIDVAYGTRK